MKRRDFLKGAAIAPAAAIPGLKTENLPGTRLVKFSDEEGSVTFDFEEKHFRVKGEPHFWNVYTQLCDWCDENLTEEQPMQRITGGPTDTGYITSLAYIADGWTNEGGAAIRGVALSGYTTMRFLVWDPTDPDQRLYLNGQIITPDRDGRLSIPNDMMVLYYNSPEESVTAINSRPANLATFTQLQGCPPDRITVFPV